MPQNITVHVDALVADAEREVETLSVADAIKLHGRSDVMFVDIRDIRELNREGRVPGAFHCPRGLLEFWIDPQSPYQSQAAVRRGQALRVLLRRRLALGAGGADGAAHGAAAGRACARRVRRLERGGRAGRGAGAAQVVRGKGQGAWGTRDRS
jgi:hypothetical protein